MRAQSELELRKTSPQITQILLDENFSRAATDVSILREIDFRESRLVIEQRADVFNDIEANIRNLSTTQPFQNFAPLERNWEFAQGRDGKIDMGGIR